MTKVAKVTEPPARTTPTDKEAEAMADARERRAAREVRVRPPKIRAQFKGQNSIAVDCPHEDVEGWGIQLCEALGVDSYAVAEALLASVGQTRAHRGISSQEDADAEAVRMTNEMAVLSAMQPQSATEALLSVQMLAAHNASMKLAHGFFGADTHDKQIERARLMNQTMRTFAAQVEAMTKLRSGGKQQVEVRYVYVDARTQTVVNGGDGGALPFSGQPHAPGALGHASAPGLPVWSEDAGGHVVPLSGREGEAAMPDARGM